MKSLADGGIRELAIESTEVKVAFILLQRRGGCKFRWRGEWEGECWD
jgi:hypothetical protein